MAQKRSRTRRSSEDKPRGEEAPGGSVATPDQDRVDDLGEAMGVPQDPDAEIRTSSEILDERDRRRMDQEP